MSRPREVIGRIIVGLFACVVACISFHALGVWLHARPAGSLGERIVRALMCEVFLVLGLFSVLAAFWCVVGYGKWTEKHMGRHATRAALYAGLGVLLTIAILLVFLWSGA